MPDDIALSRCSNTLRVGGSFLPNGIGSGLNAALASAAQKVERIDFALQKRKMIETLGWAVAAVDFMEQQYRKFLTLQAALIAANEPFSIVPNRVIDEFWHQHVLDTRKYMADCEVAFGGYFHHYPYFGMKDAADATDWRDAAAESDRLWRTVFGEALYGDTDPDADAYSLDRDFYGRLSSAIMEDETSGARCRTQCKPVRCK